MRDMRAAIFFEEQPSDAMILRVRDYAPLSFMRRVRAVPLRSLMSAEEDLNIYHARLAIILRHADAMILRFIE